MTTSETLTVSECAKIAGVANATIQQAFRHKRLKARKAGRIILIERADLIAWMNSDRRRGPKRKET